MRRIVRYLFVLALAAGAAGGRVAPAEAGGSRAEEVMKQARAAMGGEEKLRGVQSLSFKGKFRRVMQEREMSGEREFDLQLPDKFSKTESFLAGGSTTSITTSQTLSGAESWSSGRGGMIFMRGDGREPTQEEKDRAAKAATQRMRAEMARYVLALLAAPPAGFPVEFTYVGEATADDGSADVVDAAGPDGFAARLFLDKQTHLPLMLSYRAPKPRVFTMTMQGGGKGGKSPEEAAKEAQEKMKADAAAKPEEVEMQWRFSDYRQTGGLTLPHRITSGPDGETTDEFEIKSYTVNPQFKSDKFQKK
ncbi:MAG TPA: hypothetical protein VF611_15085 [Pyrinomonadaceae bacterium]|jgi:hypothetical protein